ncbi:hypothetical protein SH661x_003022 [Planctomicrobium sp. SH661]|uniref:hypothetical protein n=1 Tax=Planctomicrobium sp. SH661 TaxID=3448124 RepID=UPI003F5BC240
MKSHLRVIHWNLLPFAVFLTGLTLSGCGQKTYEERLQQSRLFYEYLQTVDEGLASPAWNRPEIGMSMRLPKPFRAPMPGPSTFKDKDGDLTTGPDPREKTSLGVPLPGLVEAWETTLDSDDGQPNAWIYLVSNQSRFRDADQGGEPPAEFLTDLENELMRVFQVTIPEGETSKVGDNVRFRQWNPAQNSAYALYTKPKDYTVIRFVPDPEFNAADLMATVYERKIGKLQVALVVLTRKSTSAAFRQRVELALGTLDIEEVISKQKRPGGGAGGASSPSSSGF